MTEPTLDEIANDATRARALSPEAAFDLLGRWSVIAPLLIAAAARRGFETAGLDVPDIDVGVAHAAKELGIAKATFYKNLAGYPFVRREGRKVLCSLRGISRWKRERQGA